MSPLWFWAWILMAIGTFAWSAWMILHIRDGLHARAGRPWSERVPVWLAVIIMDAVFFVVTYIGVLASSTEDLWYLAHPQAFNVLTNQVLFWEFGHSIVYALFFVGIAVLYWLIPILVDRPLYSWRMGIVAVLLYFLLSALLGIHHLYLTPLPIVDSFLTMIGSYGIIVPSAITFFTLWMTTKGVTRFRWNTVSLFIASAWAGGIGAGLSGGALATVSFDVVVHNTLFVVSHFHAMLVLFILPAAFAGAYVTLPLLTGRRWLSRRLGTIHFVLTTIGMAGFVFSLEELGLLGLLRREEIFPRVPAIVLGEELATVFALVIGAGQIAFLANLILDGLPRTGLGAERIDPAGRGAGPLGELARSGSRPAPFRGPDPVPVVHGTAPTDLGPAQGTLGEPVGGDRGRGPDRDAGLLVTGLPGDPGQHARRLGRPDRVGDDAGASGTIGARRSRAH